MVANKGIFLLLGTNLGDRLDHLWTAKENITADVGPIIKQSAIYETAPWGNVHQDNFLNQAIEIETLLSPVVLLERILDIELRMGRIRKEKWGPRSIDIDILLYGDIVIQSEQLEIPHPRLPERKFALTPLSEIAGDMLHPTTGQSIATMSKLCVDPEPVWLFNGA